MARVRVAIVRLAIQLLSSGLPMDVGQAGWLVSDWGTSPGKRASSAGQGRGGLRPQEDTEAGGPLCRDVSWWD